MPRDRCMHPTRSMAWEWSNPGFLTLIYVNIIIVYLQILKWNFSHQIDVFSLPIGFGNCQKAYQ